MYTVNRVMYSVAMHTQCILLAITIAEMDTYSLCIHRLSSALFVSSQEPLVDVRPVHNPIYSLATEELPLSGTDTYESVDHSSGLANNADNPIYQEHCLEPEYAYPEVLTPGQDVNSTASDCETNN